MTVHLSNSIVSPMGEATRGLSMTVPIVGPVLGTGIHMIDPIRCFSSVSLAGQFKPHYMLQRVTSTIRVVLVPARVRVKGVHSSVHKPWRSFICYRTIFTQVL